MSVTQRREPSKVIRVI